MSFSDLGPLVIHLSMIFHLRSFHAMALTGIILAGGKSQRMGQDKGLMILSNKPLISYAIEALKPLVTEILIVANSSDYDQFGYRVVNDLLPNSGPLGGLVTGLSHSKSERNMVLSCDTPFISSDLLSFLLTGVQRHEVVVPLYDGYVQPLAGLYDKSCLSQLRALVNSGQLKMRRAVQQLNCREVVIDESLDFYSESLFKNINTPEALEEAELMLKS